MKLNAADISAVILSAGFSSRMKSFKPLMSINGKKMVQICIDLFYNQGIKDIIVVTGHNKDQLEPVIRSGNARPIFNQGFTDGMLTSIQKGVQAISSRTKGFFLLPVDIPAVRPLTVQQIMAAFFKNPGKITIPCFEEKTGHPPIIPARFKKDIAGLDQPRTMRDLINANADSIKYINVHDQGVLMDADDYKGFKRVCKKLSMIDIPTKEECLSIINEQLPENDRIRHHMAEVCMTALKLSLAVKEEIDTDLVIAASLLHDIKRKEKDHAVKGAGLLKEIGFKKVGDIIAQHMDIKTDINPIKENEIVFFADKLCNGKGLDLNYTKRFAQSLKKAPWAVNSISKRYESARLIHTKIENSAGRDIKTILRAQ